MKTSAIRKSARGEDCTLRIPGVCNFNPETTVLCHAPYPSKHGTKNQSDWWAAYGCSDCHDAVDGRNNLTGCEWRTQKEEMEERWLPAIQETQAKLHQKGLLWLGGDITSKTLPRR